MDNPQDPTVGIPVVTWAGPTDVLTDSGQDLAIESLGDIQCVARFGTQRATKGFPVHFKSPFRYLVRRRSLLSLRYCLS
jgi:hypothetical protein